MSPPFSQSRSPGFSGAHALCGLLYFSFALSAKRIPRIRMHFLDRMTGSFSCSSTLGELRKETLLWYSYSPDVRPSLTVRRCRRCVT